MIHPTTPAPLVDEDHLLGDALLSWSAPVSADLAATLIATRYGLRGTATALSGEKDSNFLVRDETGRGYLLKVVHPAEDRAITAMQTAALLHVARRDPTIPTQRIVPTLDGQPEFAAPVDDGPDRMVRLVTFVEGALQRHTPQSPAQRRAIGGALARLQHALADFHHPADGHVIAWDLKHAARLRPLIAHLHDAARRRVLNDLLDRFEDRVAPRIPDMRAQVVHNDLNRDNIVVAADDPTAVRGLLDFGDMVRTAAVMDVAVGAAYQLSADETPLVGALDFIAGFDAVRPLDALERELLFDLILTRMVVRIVISERRAALFPQNRAYILRNTALAWAQIDHLAALPRDDGVAAIVRVCVDNERR